MFLTVLLSTIRSFFTVHTAMLYVVEVADSLRVGSGRNQFRPDPAHKL